eukprot:TRINITY_DN14025_c0_g1_i1.p1 TRINITY_DN14025_c0_g1~~TRINITY_DN14025_c0_g1_i1.p1  ORF type:complete len:133 (+),score=24.79 TRINITY_DN14025_c0_g1_i1:27-425(+)
MGDWKSQYPLHASACEGTFDVAEREVKSGADVNAPDDEDSGFWTPLHYASWYNQPKIVKLLLDNGAQVNATNNKNSTPLHFAAGVGNLEIVKMLLAHGANKAAVDKEKYTPLSLTKELKPDSWKEIVALLQN